MRLKYRFLLILVLVLLLAIAGCYNPQSLDVTNGTGTWVDLNWTSELEDDDTSRITLDKPIVVGEVDPYPGCEPCNAYPGSTETLWGFRKRSKYNREATHHLMARDALTEVVLYHQTFTYSELSKMKWRVTIVDQTK
jgi:hypothetical protein